MPDKNTTTTTALSHTPIFCPLNPSLALFFPFILKRLYFISLPFSSLIHSSQYILSTTLELIFINFLTLSIYVTLLKKTNCAHQKKVLMLVVIEMIAIRWRDFYKNSISSWDNFEE